MKDIDTDVPLAPRAKKTPTDHTLAAPETLSVASFYAQGRALVDARKTHLSRVGIGVPQHDEMPNAAAFGRIGPAQAPSLPPVAGAQEIPSQRTMLAMDAHEASAPLPEAPAPPEGQATLYKPRTIPADAVNYEA